MLDADVFLTNPNTLRNLVFKKHTIVSPLLRSDGMYSNFWAGMTVEHYYMRTEFYEPILYREKIGCHNVPMVHSAVLVDLRRYDSDRLSYKAEKLIAYDGPVDDIITFAVGANKSGKCLKNCCLYNLLNYRIYKIYLYYVRLYFYVVLLLIVCVHNRGVRVYARGDY